jgi:hypothetical protein
MHSILYRNSTDGLLVTIGGVPCTVQSINSTSIICTTGRASQTNLDASVDVFINGSGYAFSLFQFQYLDLWSSQWTWGGDSPPEAGTIVSIDSGVIVFLDITPPMLKAIVVDNATLIFDDSQDIDLNVEYIVIVNGGLLQVGTETNPFQHRATITLYGQLRSIELPICKW